MEYSQGQSVEADITTEPVGVVFAKKGSPRCLVRDRRDTAGAHT